MTIGGRNYDQGVFTLQKEVVYLEYNFVVGTTGAVGTIKGSCKSIVRDAQGAYTITLDEGYNRMLSGGYGFVGTTCSGIVDVQIDDLSIQTNIQSGVLKIKCYNAAGSAADPASGVVLLMWGLFRKSSVLGKGE